MTTELEKTTPQIKTVEDVNAFVREIVSEEAAELREELQKLHKQLSEEKGTSYADAVAQLRNVADGKSAAATAREKEPGHLFARFVACLGKSADERMRKQRFVSPQDIAKSMFGEGDPVTKALAAGDFDAGGSMVPEEISNDLIEALYPRSVFMQGGPMVVPNPSGTQLIPEITSGSSASWVGEVTGPNATTVVTAQKRLSAKKLRVTLPISNDWLRRSNPRAEQAVVRDITRAAGKELDAAFIRGDGTENSPRGLKAQMASGNKENVNGTVNLANVTTDLGKLWLDLEGNDVQIDSGYWMWAPRTENYLRTLRDSNGNFAFRAELLADSFWGGRHGYTSNIPINLAVTGTNESEIYLVNMNDVIVGETLTMEITVSAEASYKNASGTLVSAFDNDQSVIRLIHEVDMVLRHDVAAAMLTDVDWV